MCDDAKAKYLAKDPNTIIFFGFGSVAIGYMIKVKIKGQVFVKLRPTPRAPDGWDSPRFQAGCVAEGWFRQSGIPSSRPPAGNASRWAADNKK